MKMKMKMSNAIARKYFLHAQDTNADTGLRCCFFSNGGEENGWGFWVHRDGTIDVDNVSSNGELPSTNIVEACKRAAVKYLS